MNRLTRGMTETHLDMYDRANVLPHTYTYEYDPFGNLEEKDEVKPPGYQTLALYLTSRPETAGMDPTTQPGYLTGNRHETPQMAADPRKATEADGGVALHYGEEGRKSLTKEMRPYPAAQ